MCYYVVTVRKHKRGFNMIYTAEQKQLLSQLDDSSKRLDKVRKQIQYLEDDLYALEDDLYAIEKDKQVVIGLLCDTGLEPEDL